MRSLPAAILLGLLALGAAPGLAQEGSGQSVKDKLRSTLPP
ncbi:MAG: hypothetical protein NTX57_16705 [Armatimonadetes bacterium]|nr:hypothetical protein [Armatimonadota bacterium]